MTDRDTCPKGEYYREVGWKDNGRLLLCLQKLLSMTLYVMECTQIMGIDDHLQEKN